jgi:Flp pilus assembly protein TadG
VRKLLQTDGGQALVETAIVLPVVVLMLFGILDAGRIFYTWNVVTNSAREGARVGAVQTTYNVNAVKVAAAAAGASVGVTAANVNPTCPGTCGSSSLLSVQVSKNVSMITPVISAIFGSTVNVTNTAVMRRE